MSIYLAAVLIGIVAGLRAMTAPAAVSWAAKLGWLKLEGTWAAFLGYSLTPFILAALAVVELITDQLPKTPSRKVPIQFGTRLVTGGLSGAAIGATADSTVVGLLLGIAGAVAGTLGGFEARKRLVQAIGGKDLPIALLEDVVAVAVAFLILAAVAA